MFVNKANLMLSGVLYPKEMQIFVHFFCRWRNAREMRNAYIKGENVKTSFSVVEEAVSLGENWVEEKYHMATEVAANKLFKLDRPFYQSHHLHIVKKLETFIDMEAALEEIERLLEA